ncbi:MAG: class I SAM-dependent methyltransferase [Pseudonocardia sp.]
MTSGELAATFNAAQRGFRALSAVLWEPLGAALAERAQLAPGQRVLDVCAGAGASAIPAAQAVGLHGQVDAVDLAANLLAEGRAKAAHLPQLRFVQADVLSWQPPGVRYDRVLCGYGVFFLPDMDAGACHLISLLREGGRLAVSTWAKGSLSEVLNCLFDAVAELLGAPVPTSPARAAAARIETEALMSGWLDALGLVDTQVSRVSLQLRLTPELAWDLAQGTGARRAFDALDQAGVDRVRQGYLRRLRDRGMDVLDASSLIGTGHRS